MTIQLQPRHLVAIAVIVGCLLVEQYGGAIVPDVVPDAAPFDADGLHVLMVYQDTDAKDLTGDQKELLFGTDTREFLKSACGDDGYRVFDADSDMEHAEQPWKDAMAVPRESVPWVVASNGETGFSRPLTMSPEEFEALVGEHE